MLTVKGILYFLRTLHKMIFRLYQYKKKVKIQQHFSYVIFISMYKCNLKIYHVL